MNTRVFLIFLLVGIWVGAGTVQAQSLRGDVNGDGNIDGKDALLLLRMVEGLEPMTEQAKTAGDIYPVNGTGERPFGDGQLTQEDVRQILRIIVGAISLGEVTGRFESPLIEDFSPRIGVVGTEVRIKGSNFVGGDLGKSVMIILFGGVPAVSVTPISSTEVKVVVPEGATSSYITVTTPGGEARSGEPFLVLEMTEGEISLPSSFSVTDVDVVSTAGEGSSDGKGGFSAPTVLERATLVSVIPKNKPNNAFLSLLPSSGHRDGTPPRVDARSTAEALVLMQPLFATVKGDLYLSLQRKLDTLPELDALSEMVEQVWSDSDDPFNDERLGPPLKAAVEALANSLSSPGSDGGEERMSTSSSDSSTKMFFNVDAKFLGLKFAGDSVEVSLEFGSPVDWFVRMAKLDLKKLPDSISSLKADEVYSRLDFSDTTFLPATRVTSEIIGAIIPIVLNAVAKSVPGTIGATGEAAGLLPSEGRLSLESNADHAVYVVRAFSGILFSSGGSDSATVARLPYGRGDELTALMTNIVVAAWEVANVYVPTLSLIPPSVGGEIIRRVILVIYDEVEDLMSQSSASSQGVASSPSRTGDLADRVYRIVAKTLQEIISQLQSRLPRGMGPVLEKVSGQVVNVADVAAKVAGILPVAERVAGIAGLQIPGLDLLELTPLETSFVVVGNPFGARIVDFTPKEGKPGDVVQIEGIGFDPEVENNRVYFADVRARALEVHKYVPTSFASDGDIIVVEVPAGVRPGKVSVSIQVVGAKLGVASDRFTMMRLPIIEAISPSEGFTAGNTFKGEIYQGTPVRIEGLFLAPSKDEVFFGDVRAEVIENKSSTTVLTVRVPAGAKSGKVIVKTPDGLVAESPEPFTLIDPPTLSQISPPEAKAGQTLTLIGTDFGFSYTDVQVQLETEGQTEFLYTRFVSSTTLTVTMSSLVGEGKEAYLKVITPAGSSNALTVTRLKGREKGANLDPTEMKGVQPDGVLSLEEALNFAQGKADIFSVSEGWDDVDRDVVIKRQDIYKWVSKDTDGDGEIEPGEGYWTFDRTVYSLISDNPKAKRGHKGKETAYVKVEIYEKKDEERFLSEGYDAVNMDDPGITDIYGHTIPGIGKVEEGDLVNTDNIGRDFADWISMTAPSGSILPLIRLDEPGAGDDKLNIEVTEGKVVHNGDIVVETNGNEISGGISVGGSILVEGGLVIKGNNNKIDVGGGGDLLIKQGVLIDGSHGNIIGDVKVTDAVTGFRVIGGARGNKLHGSAENCTVGYELSGGATGNRVYGSVLNCNVGVKLLGEETRANTVEIGGDPNYTSVTGAELSDGASGNFVYATGFAEDGIVVKGKGTSGNMLRAEQNKGNGIRIMQGATDNIVPPTYSVPSVFENGKHGVLIEGDGTDNNRIQGWISHNGEAGIYIKGAGLLSPMGTVIEDARFSDNGTVGLLVEDLQGQNSPVVSVIDCDFKPIYHTPTPAIVLKDASDVLLEDINVSSHDVALLITGEDSVNNEIINLQVNGASIGVHLKDYTSSNRILAPYLTGCSQYGILIEGAAKNMIGRSSSSRPRMSENKTDVMIRGDAHDNVVQDIYFDSKGHDAVVIEGVGTTGNVVEDCFFSGGRVVIQGGAQRTTIGSLVPEEGNTFFSSETDEDMGVKVLGSTTQDVLIVGNTIRSAEEAVVVGSAQNVRIGVQGAANWIADAAIGVRLSGAQNVFVMGNFFDGNEIGVLVKDGNTEVTVGGLRQDEGNTFFGGHDIAIHVTGADNRSIRLLNNLIYGESEEWSRNRVGIVLDGGSRDVAVRSNRVKLSKEDGIQVIGDTTGGNLIEGNIIVNNGRHGVYVANGARLNTIRNNTIYSNGGRGIALEGGNDSISSATFTMYVPATGQVAGTVPTSVPVGSIVEIFSDVEDEGKIRLGVANVRAGRDFLTRLHKHLPPGMNLTATVTDPQGNTSEFSDRFEPVGYRPPSIVYTTTRFGNRDIHRLFAGEQVGAQLTTDPAVDQSPVLSPDGQLVAFVSERSGNFDVWLIDSGGANPQNLTNHPAADFDPIWSPDGGRIAFVSDRDGNPEIFVMDADGQNVQQLTHTEGIANLHPTWSSDSTKIAFARGQMIEGGQIVDLEIFVMNADGSDSINITNHAANDDRPAWSPDGGDIAFVSDRDGNLEIYLMKPDGSDIRRLTRNTAVDTDPAWVSDRQLLFSSNRVRDFEVYLMDRDGGNLLRLTLSLGINIHPNAGQQ
jgi:parallel beta-helix repeat protein